jgi:hypothetical protein
MGTALAEFHAKPGTAFSGATIPGTGTELAEARFTQLLEAAVMAEKLSHHTCT